MERGGTNSSSQISLSHVATTLGNFLLSCAVMNCYRPVKRGSHSLDDTLVDVKLYIFSLLFSNFPFLSILNKFVVCRLFEDSHFDRGEVIAH